MGDNNQASYNSFRALREKHTYYADKTDMLHEYLSRKFEKAVLFARPHHFGKTLTVTMFRDFLDIRQKSVDLFNGLNIMEYPDTVKNFMNQYPVVFLSLKEMLGESFEAIFRNYQSIVSALSKKYGFLLESSKVNRFDKDLLVKLIQKESGLEDTIEVLDLLSRMLHAQYNRPVFVIIDDYDFPIAEALGTPAYEMVQNMISHMLSYICKTNDNVKAVILSGCMYSVTNTSHI